MGNKNDLITPYQTYYWYADSLFYIIDKKYKDIEELGQATNGTNICLGWETFRHNSIIEDNQLTEPILISSEQIPDSVLSISADYKEVTEEDMFNKIHRNGDIMDEEIMELKRSLPPQPYYPPPPPPPQTLPKHKPKKYPQKNTHNQPTKSPAIKPKQ